jgi:hypothetical protein
MKRIPTLVSIAISAAAAAAEPRDTMPDTWVATDAPGRVLPLHPETGPPRANRTVGIFYFNWHAAFGSPEVHDISKILAANPANPQWGPQHAPHYWSEPRFGYYRPDDPWVIRKHMQMLADAGVDVLIMDATNAYTYDAEREALCAVLEQMRAEGRQVPRIAMFANSYHVPTVQHLWDTFYQPGRYRESWFYWKGRPLLLSPPDGLPAEVNAGFTTRQSWAWTTGQPWFGDGYHKWPWLDFAPQTPGWHDAPNIPECVPVSVSQHPISNIGRSYQSGSQPPPGQRNPELGPYFAEQWRSALRIDPEFIFITGWNEWVAQRFLNDGSVPSFLGNPLPLGETFFVDLYNEEYNRDIEPMRGGYGDNTYWQMVANIRRYKGTRPPPAASAAQTIAIPGGFSQWAGVRPVFLDDLHDTTHRDHAGVSNAGRYLNTSGRNDLDEMRVSHDGAHLFFFASTRESLTPASDADWMCLLIDIDQSAASGWHGYDFRINHTRPAAGICSVERWSGGAWENIGGAILEAGDKQLHLAVPRALLGIAADPHPHFDFKWTDNIPGTAEAIDFLDHGDSAPNARFNYRYQAVQPTELVTNGDFETGGNLFNSSPHGWNNTVPGDGTGTGQYDAGPAGNTVAYMAAGTQIFQTFLDTKLQPDTTYTVTFSAMISAGNGPASLFTDVAYGVGSAGTSSFNPTAGYITAADLRSGSTSNYAPLSNSPQTFTYSFTTKPVITGSASDIAIYMQPSTGFDGVQASQCYIDNVSVVAAPASIVYGGTQTGGAANGRVVENWSNAGVPKPHDSDGDNKYGSAGYVQFRPWGPWTGGEGGFPGAAVISEGIADGNDLGTASATAPTVLSQPSFVSGLYQGGAAANGHAFVSFPSYPVFTNPDGMGLSRQGGISLPVPGSGPSPAGSGNWGNAVIFQLSQTKSFRLGVVVDAVGDGGIYAPDYVTVYSVARNKTFYSAPLVRDGNPDIVFFDIEGTAGDTLAVAVWRSQYVNPGDSGIIALSMLTFDEIVAEPATPPALSCSRSGSYFTLFWPTSYTSWTLESSADLAPASWIPVPGVTDNSVTIDMTVVPKKFFRLKKN